MSTARLSLHLTVSNLHRRKKARTMPDWYVMRKLTSARLAYQTGVSVIMAALLVLIVLVVEVLRFGPALHKRSD